MGGAQPGYEGRRGEEREAAARFTKTAAKHVVLDKR